MAMLVMCFLSTNSQYVNNRHANKQLVNSENCSKYLQTIIIIIIVVVVVVEILYEQHNMFSIKLDLY